MFRRIALVGLVAVVVSISWLRLETLSVSWRDWLPILLLAFLPVAAVALARPKLVVAAVLALSTLLAAAVA